MLDGDPFLYFSDLLVLMVVVVPAYFLLPWMWARQLLLGLTGAYLLFLVAPRLLLLYVVFWLGVYVLQLAATLWRDRRRAGCGPRSSWCQPWRRWCVWKLAAEWFVVGFNLHMNGFVDWLSPWTGAIDRVRNLILPIGLSFATFRAVDQLIKVRLEIVPPLNPLQSVRLRLLSDRPDHRTRDRVHRDRGRAPAAHAVGSAGHPERTPDDQRRCGEGLPVRVPAAGQSGRLRPRRPPGFSAGVLARARDVRRGTSTSTSPGFSDMAIGSARILGFRLAPNFNNPYLKTNPQDFWNSWHMSLTRFAQRNVFVPMGGMRARTQYVAIVATMMVIALWHDLSIPLVIFGLYHSAGLILHRRWVARHPCRRRDAAWRAESGAWFAFFVFYLISLPLLLLDLSALPGLLREAAAMIADRLLAGLRERLGFVPTTWSLVRIAGFTIAGLVIASLVVPARPGDLATAPYNPGLATRTTRNVSPAVR